MGNNRQVLKTAIAATIATMVFIHFNFEHGHWIILGAVWVMQSDSNTGFIEQALREGIRRIIATIVGASIGLVGYGCMQMVVADGTLWMVYPIIFLFMYVTTLLRKRFETLDFVVISTALIMVIGMTQDNAFEVAKMRAIEVVIGVMIGVLVSVCIWPRRLTQQIQSQLNIIHHTLLDALVAFHNIAHYSETAQDLTIEQCNHRLENELARAQTLTHRLKRSSRNPARNQKNCKRLANYEIITLEYRQLMSYMQKSTQLTCDHPPLIHQRKALIQATLSFLGSAHTGDVNLPTQYTHCQHILARHHQAITTYLSEATSKQKSVSHVLDWVILEHQLESLIKTILSAYGERHT